MNQAYYNEHDPKAAAWLRELIKAGLIAPGIVDERSIVDVNPYELTQYTQHHFFAGIGGWSYALRLAGWPDSKPVVTGSCPCQPWSDAGDKEGESDERHLWPALRNCITFLNAPVYFGEQVASKIALRWLDSVFSDLEGEGYACGAADLCAAGVGAVHRRQRLFIVAHADRQRFKIRSQSNRQALESKQQASRRRDIDGCSSHVPHALRSRLSVIQGQQAEAESSGRTIIDTANWWASEPDVGRVADGLPGQVAQLRGLGNAINPQVAAEFIKAASECLTSSP